ncbi:MAG: RsmB/NOP family class I SAM-dependent RNA methyltransferase [Deltaproteobacteria bacterium]|nr:RsmB/NOP family class I SAM-dependent RNA methyltransferase [Deltaproteobacteria bacterium]
MSGTEREKRSTKAVRAALAALDGAAAGRPLALALSEALRAEEGLGPQERRAAATAARGAVRELRRIDLVLAQASKAAGLDLRRTPGHDRTLLRYLALRVSIEAEAPERPLRELALPGPRRPRSIGDDVLARVAAHLPPADALPLPADPVVALGVRRSVPDFLARRLVEDLGPARADAVLAALNLPARLDLRANRLLATREEAAARLADEGVAAAPLLLAPDGLVVADRAGLFGRTHAAGLFELQDEGSQLIALLCGLRPGETAIDLCAGSGGKALALAAAVGGQGRVVACDPMAHRLAELPARARRARAQRIIEMGGAGPSAELVGRADVVLVDAPCSGVGSLRREPDLRWRLTEKDLDAYPVRQSSILEEASRFVRPEGGRLVYATCSPLRSEGEQVVAAFLKKHPEYRLDPAEHFLPESAVEDGFLRSWPDRHGGGAFFAARLSRSR